MLTLSIICSLKTQQVDYSNAFAQVEIKDEVYITLLDGVDAPIDGNVILKLQKSLYGFESPLTRFDKVSTGLKIRGFIISEINQCFFIKPILYSSSTWTVPSLLKET